MDKILTLGGYTIFMKYFVFMTPVESRTFKDMNHKPMTQHWFYIHFNTTHADNMIRFDFDTKEEAESERAKYEQAIRVEY